MSAALRWIVIAVAVLVIVGLLAFARGKTNHRGDDVGSFPDGARFGAGARSGL